MPRAWERKWLVAFQVRVPIQMKERIVARSQTTGKSQQAILIEALEAYFGQDEQPRQPSADPTHAPSVARGELLGH